MDIGEQKRVIQVEPEPLRAPTEPPEPERPVGPDPVPDREREPVPVRPG